MEDFVTFEQARLLDDLGFDYKTIYGYYKLLDETPQLAHINRCEVMSWEHDSMEFYHAPTLSQAQKWLREVKGVDITIEHVYHRLNTGDKIMYGLHIGNQSTFKTEFYMNYASYEEALSKGIDSALLYIE